MEAVIGLFIGVLAMSLVLSLGSRLWFLFRWHVLGWRPAILDETLLNEAVQECARDAVATDARDAKELHGYEMSEDDKERHYQTVSTAFRRVIEHYVKKFSMSGR
jgi:hypothetical protein